MKALSASSQAADPFRAGLTLGRRLRVIEPEVVFVFTSIEHGAGGEFLDGLHSGLESPDAAVIGSTGDGCYSTDGITPHGVSGLALNSGGTVDWAVDTVSGSGTHPAEAVERLFSSVRARGTPAFAYLVSDFRTDAGFIEDVLRRHSDIPVVGGLAADDDRLSQAILYANNTAFADGMALLTAYGPLRVSTHLAHGMTPVGTAARVDEADGRTLRRIDGLPATDFVESATGKPVLRSDRGVTSLRLSDPGDPGYVRLRSVVPDFAGEEGVLGVFGGIRTGEHVQVCTPETGELTEDMSRTVAEARNQARAPAAALVVSCAGRKWFLGPEIEGEVSSLQNAFGETLAIGGFASFGEIAPLRGSDGGTTNAFHNMSYVLTLFDS